MSHRSYSAVKSLRSCGEQYRLERIERVDQRPTAAAVAGTVIHRATEVIDYEIAGGETDPAQLLQSALRIAEDVEKSEIERQANQSFPTPETWRAFGQSKYNPTGQDLDWFTRVGIPGSLENYIYWRQQVVPHYELLVLPSGELAIEVPFEITIEDGSDPIRGQIDRVFVDTKDNYSVILDIKSGQKPESTEQLGVYKQAMGLMYPDSGPYFGAYLYGLKPGSKTGVRHTFPNILTSWDGKALSQIYGQADRQIEQQIFLPNPGKACFLCSVSHACPFYSASVVA